MFTLIQHFVQDVRNFVDMYRNTCIRLLKNYDIAYVNILLLFISLEIHTVI